ncbi:hypothetical protein [Actinoplanes sp. URMC 104]|uniref:hypothetical protein n=1 Tax=Actinoplanes sp. URMC 104 TaxID=3423409 RepID=UPI003F1B6F14
MIAALVAVVLAAAPAPVGDRAPAPCPTRVDTFAAALRAGGSDHRSAQNFAVLTVRDCADQRIERGLPRR